MNQEDQMAYCLGKSLVQLGKELDNNVAPEGRPPVFLGNVPQDIVAEIKGVESTLYRFANFNYNNDNETYMTQFQREAASVSDQSNVWQNVPVRENYLLGRSAQSNVQLPNQPVNVNLTDPLDIVSDNLTSLIQAHAQKLANMSAAQLNVQPVQRVHESQAINEVAKRSASPDVLLGASASQESPLQVVENLVDLIYQKLKSVGTDILKQFSDTYYYGVYKDNLPKRLEPMVYNEFSKVKLNAIFARAQDVLTTKEVLSTPLSYLSSYFNFDPEANITNIAKLYGTDQIRDITHRLLDNWQRDTEFCEELLQGVNPLMITVVKTLDQVPETMRNTTIKGQDGKDLGVQQLIGDKRLFIVDYKDLANIVAQQGANDAPLYAPYLLVYRRQDDLVDIFAIQLERKPQARVFTAGNTGPNLWKLVKMHVACADNQIHEFRFHLGLSHFCQEPVVIAVNNQLKNHLIGNLLTPHLQGTIFINYMARIVLVGKISPNREAHLELAAAAWENYNFLNGGFANDVINRGFPEDKSDGLKNYFYRDDGFGLWKAIGNYAKNVVDSKYGSDDDVKYDAAIQAWAKEMTDPTLANVKGFPSQILTKKSLVEVCQIIIWNGSGLHSAINYSQWPYFAHGKSRPISVNNVAIPPVGQDIAEGDLVKATQPTATSIVQILFAWLLTQQVDETTLPKFATNDQLLNKSIVEFQKELKTLTATIQSRNAGLVKASKTPYYFCMPENVNCSVNI